MADIRKTALAKMLKEMQEQHSGAEDAIHNWLCDHDDETLLQGILKEGCTIKGAMQYCVSQAEKQKTGNAAMVDDQTVFSWVRKYFTSQLWLPLMLNRIQKSKKNANAKKLRKIQRSKSS